MPFVSELIVYVASLLPIGLAQVRAADAAPNGAFAFPATHAGRCAAAFVEAFNSGDPSRVRAFEEKHRAKSALKERSIDDRIKQFGQMKADWGKLDPRHVVASSEREVTVLLHAHARDELFEFRFVFEEQEPYGMHHIVIQGPVRHDEAVANNQPLDAQAIADAVAKTAALVEANYVFPDVGATMAAKLRENDKSGAYQNVTSAGELANRLTDDLRAVCKDKHLHVSAAALPDEKEGGPMRHRGTPDDARRENYGFRKVELLPGNIGYVKFDEFHPSEAAKQVAAGAMSFLANVDALIFDLRENGGGSPEMIAFLSSYLFDKPTHLNSFYDRSSNKTEEFWTQDVVPGRRFANDLPVFVLVSNYTFSGAEEFAYNLLNLKRATIIGQTTGGGAHPVNAMPINDRFSMMVPYARAMNPISKTNWEGVGVKPDIEVPASEALNRATEEAMKMVGRRTVVTGKP